MKFETPEILIVDDETAIRESLKEILVDEGYLVLEADSAATAQEQMRSTVDAVILDIRLGADNGIELLKQLKNDYPSIPVIMISGHGTIALASEAFRAGAHEFLEKPLRLLNVRTCVRNAVEATLLKHRLAATSKNTLPKPVYKSQVMTDLYAQTHKLASLADPVVIIGDSGSGKELLAHALHYSGKRSDGPFIATNAASMPVTLAEDELFGHEKGAFTGADARRKGVLEQADGGTLFLDEIGDMDPAIQAKLLRVIETGSFTRLGGNTPVAVKVRIVSATHKNLEEMVAQKVFRQDLWYRLSTFVLRVPPLDKRKDDVALLAETFLAATAVQMELNKTFSDDALVFLTKRLYPGNVRELRHIVTRAAVFCDGAVITAADLAAMMEPQTASLKESGVDYSQYDFRDAKNHFELDYFTTVLNRHNGNITLAAASINMAQSNLSRKLKELGIRS